MGIVRHKGCGRALLRNACVWDSSADQRGRCRSIGLQDGRRRNTSALRNGGGSGFSRFLLARDAISAQ